MKNSIIISGKSGSGKTKGILFKEVNNIIDKEDNLLIVDSKEEYYNRFSKQLKEKGYNIVVLNLKDVKRSNCFNPYALPYYYYQNKDKDKAAELIDMIGHQIFEENKASDPFWTNTSTDLLTGLTILLMQNTTKEKVNIGSLNIAVDLIGKGNEYNGTFEEYLKNISTSDPVYICTSGTVFAPPETKGSILSVVRQRIKKYCMRENLMNLLCNTDFEVENIGKEKTAIFIITREDNKGINEIGNMLIEEVFSLVNFNNLKFNFILDNIETLKPIDSLNNMIDMNSENIKVYVATRNIDVLKEEYSKNIFTNISKVINAEEENIEIDNQTKEKEELPTVTKTAEYFDIKEIIK